MLRSCFQVFVNIVQLSAVCSHSEALLNHLMDTWLQEGFMKGKKGWHSSQHLLGEMSYVYMKLGLLKAHRSFLPSLLISRSAPHALFKLWSFNFKQGNLYQGDLGCISALKGRVFHFFRTSTQLIFGVDPEKTD